ncbi:hypothetical protein FS842_008114 [Serendipita sp. 407]|nr:hypothetical protein FS842_008114 [Serendipita sp. 407]
MRYLSIVGRFQPNAYYPPFPYPPQCLAPRIRSFSPSCSFFFLFLPVIVGFSLLFPPFFSQSLPTNDTLSFHVPSLFFFGGIRRINRSSSLTHNPPACLTYVPFPLTWKGPGASDLLARSTRGHVPHFTYL